MPDYLDRIGLYRDFNAAFFRLPPAGLAALLIGELMRAGAVKREERVARPRQSERDDGAHSR